ncbi:PPE family protein, partial [Mycobacterium tuberculosis]
QQRRGRRNHNPIPMARNCTVFRRNVRSI